MDNKTLKELNTRKRLAKVKEERHNAERLNILAAFLNAIDHPTSREHMDILFKYIFENSAIIAGSSALRAYIDLRNGSKDEGSWKAHDIDIFVPYDSEKSYNKDIIQGIFDAFGYRPDALESIHENVEITTDINRRTINANYATRDIITVINLNKYVKELPPFQFILLEFNNRIRTEFGSFDSYVMERFDYTICQVYCKHHMDRLILATANAGVTKDIMENKLRFNSIGLYRTRLSRSLFDVTKTVTERFTKYITRGFLPYTETEFQTSGRTTEQERLSFEPSPIKLMLKLLGSHFADAFERYIKEKIETVSAYEESVSGAIWSAKVIEQKKRKIYNRFYNQIREHLEEEELKSALENSKEYFERRLTGANQNSSDKEKQVQRLRSEISAKKEELGILLNNHQKFSSIFNGKQKKNSQKNIDSNKKEISSLKDQLKACKVGRKEGYENLRIATDLSSFYKDYIDVNQLLDSANNFVSELEQQEVEWYNNHQKFIHQVSTMIEDATQNSNAGYIPIEEANMSDDMSFLYENIVSVRKQEFIHFFNMLEMLKRKKNNRVQFTDKRIEIYEEIDHMTDSMTKQRKLIRLKFREVEVQLKKINENNLWRSLGANIGTIVKDKELKDSIQYEVDYFHNQSSKPTEGVAGGKIFKTRRTKRV